MRKYVTEFIGTFGLVFTVGCAVMGKAALAPLAIGAALMVFVYAGGHISGGHYNPAVSLAACLRGRLSGHDLGRYWLAQGAGALVAAGLATFVVNPAPFPALDMSGRAVGAGLVAEFIFTFALAHQRRRLQPRRRARRLGHGPVLLVKHLDLPAGRLRRRRGRRTGFPLPEPRRPGPRRPAPSPNRARERRLSPVVLGPTQAPALLGAT